MMRRLFISTLVIVCLVSLCAFGESAVDNWPRWRGPLDTGVAPKGNPPVTWSETENVKWKTELSMNGDSSPIIWGDKIFFQTAVKTSGDAYRFVVICLDKNTGEVLWEKTAKEAVPHEETHEDHGYASYSPVTDGKLLWASFGSFGLYCFDLDGNQKWDIEMPKMAMRNQFGEASSPALAGDALIVLVDHEGDDSILAVNKNTGKTIWKKNRDEPSGWTTPVVVEVEGRLQIIVNATKLVRSYDAKTGDVIWECTGQTKNVIPTPVVGFGKVFVTSGFRGSMLQAIELGRTGTLTEGNGIVWQISERGLTPYVPSSALYGKNLYVIGGNSSELTCFDAETGKIHYKKQALEGIEGIYASPVGAADRVYFSGREGNFTVIKNSNTLEVLATNKLNDQFDATPAIVGNEIFLKGNKSIYCISESK